MAIMSALPRVGFAGLGVMGRPMAEHLGAAGYAMRLYDIVPGLSAEAAAAIGGAQACASPAELAGASDIVVTMVPNGQVVHDLVAGADGLLAGFAPGALLLDTSSSEPWLTRRTATLLAARDVAMVDAPVSGARWGAEAAELVFMVGGAADAVARVRPLLERLGKAVFHLGALGAGHAMKCLNNLVTAVNFLAVSEGLVIGKRHGLDPAAMVDVLNASTGMSWMSQTHLRQRVISRRFDDPFKLALMNKDIGIALELARSSAAPAPLSALAQQLWRAAARRRRARSEHQRARALGRADQRHRAQRRRGAAKGALMRVLVTGAAGFIGRALAADLGVDLAGSDELRLADRAAADVPLDTPAAVHREVGDLADAAVQERLFAAPVDRVFHLAGIVSGAAESDFALGKRVNLDATIALLERCRIQVERTGTVARFVYASSIAVFGTPLPARIDDSTAPAPTLSYGTHKRACELLIDDYTRRGFVDGRALRLPGVAVRPPLANGALSAFNSDLLREPLAGRDYVCPVSRAATIWITSLRRAVASLLPARRGRRRGARAGARAQRPGPGGRASARSSMPSAASIRAPRRAVRFAPQPALEAQFGRWPVDCAFDRARALGLATEPRSMP